VLPQEIDNTPPAISLLNVSHRERRDLGAPEPAAKKHSQDCAIA